jgi:hypothetical protein
MTLPTFIVIGVAKGGTTSIYRYLDQHPDVFMCPDKGPNYFGYEDAKNWQWHEEGEPPLLRHFKVSTLEEYEALFEGVTWEHAVGEVSPQYFRCPTAARRIHEVVPDVRLVASLRNPADRAFSGFLMRMRRGETVADAHVELTAESSHVKEGFYHTRMKRFYDVFDREQIKIYLFDEFRKSPGEVVRDLFGFVGVDTGFVPDTTVKHNPANIPKSAWLNRVLYQPRVIRAVKALLPARLEKTAKRLRQRNLSPAPSFPADLRAELLDLYREDILRLEELIDRDLSGWFEPLPAR